MNEHIIPKEFSQDDRIGNFTIPQALILGVCVLLSMFLLVIGINIFVAMVLAALIFSIGAVFMYKKINNIPLYEFLLIYVIYSATPKLLIFRADSHRDELALELELLIDEDEAPSSKKKGGFRK